MTPRTVAKITFSITTNQTGMRGEQTIVDFARESEVEDQRQGDALDGGEKRRERDDAGQHQGDEVWRGQADVRKNFSEDEEEEQRLHERLQQEHDELAAGDDDVAFQDGDESRYGEREVRIAESHQRKMPPGEVDENFFEGGPA